MKWKNTFGKEKKKKRLKMTRMKKEECKQTER